MSIEDAREQAKAKRAKAIHTLRKCGMTDDEIAKELGLESLGELLSDQRSRDAKRAKDRERERNSTSDRLPAKIEHAGSQDDSDEPLDVEVIELGDLSSDGGMEAAATIFAGRENSAPAPNEVANQQNPIKYKQYSEEWWATVRPDVKAKRCKAHRKNGNQCLKAAIDGATVCRTHGGAAAHVQRAAKARLENAADRMAKELLGIAIDEKTSDSVKLKAIIAALDRAGLKPSTEVVVSAGNTSGFDEIYTDVFTGTRAESRRARGMELGPNDIAALGYSGDTQIESSRASVIDADGYEVTDSNPNIEGVQRFSPDTDISATPNRPGGRGYGGVGPNSMADYDRLRGPQSDRERFRVHHVTGEDAIRVARQQRELTAGD